MYSCTASIFEHIVSIYNMPHKADTTVICQCGAMVCKYYMPKHLSTAQHERDMVGREHIEVAKHLRYIPRN